MRRMIASFMALLMIFGIAATNAEAANLTTEQKFEVLRQKGIVSGFADGSSRLNDSMSREQLASILFRLLELPEQIFSPSYGDVLKTRWSFQEVEAVSRAGLMVGTRAQVFSPAKSVTVEQLAAVIIRSYGLNSNSTTIVTGKVSKWARGVVSLALDKQLIPRLNDYTINATRAMMVDAAYAVYEDTQIEELLVRSVEALTNQAVKVNLLQPIKQVDTNRFVLKDNNGRSLSILQATLNQDGMTVILWTDRQSGSVNHTLYVDGIAWNYISISDDTIKPQIQSFVSLSNRTLEITFTEPVEASTATNTSHYQLDNGLKLETLQLSSDLRKVTLTTKEQTHGKSYRLTVRNVKDLAGNVMDNRGDLTFIGNNDFAKPKVTLVQVNANASLTVKFSEKINAANAVLTNHYSIDKGLAVTQAKLENDGVTVTLTTSPQKDATLYSLTVSGIPDLVGNLMDTSSGWMFGGVANPEVPVKFQELQAIDRNTVELVFNRALTDSDVNNLKLAILSDNGSGVSMSDWQAYVRRKAGSDKVVTVQYRNKTSNNPDLFKSGHVYVGRVSGVAGLQTANDSDRLIFAGTEAVNRVPYVTQVIAFSEDRVRVLFNEPVTNVDESAFRIWNKEGQAVDIGYDELNDKNKLVTEVILKLDDKLIKGNAYTMTFITNIITDAPQWNGLQTTDGSKPFVINFIAN